MANVYYSGQGTLYVATRDGGGVPQGFVSCGNVPKLTVDITTTKLEHKESESGQRLTDISIITQKTGKCTFQLDNLNMDNLALALYGTYATVNAGSAVNEVITAYVGKKTPLTYPKPTSVVVTHSSGSPTYTVGTDYTVDTLNGGITIPATGSAITNAQSIKVSYSYAANKKLDAFTSTAAPERWFRFEGLNTIDGSSVIVNLFRARLDPLTGYDFISDALTTITVTADLLADATKSTGSQFFNEITFS